MKMMFSDETAEPTLEDHFDKTVLPKVMQVKYTVCWLCVPNCCSCLSVSEYLE